MCKRSNPTMEFALILLETELKAAAAYLSELTTRLQVGFCVCVCVCVCVCACAYMNVGLAVHFSRFLVHGCAYYTSWSG